MKKISIGRAVTLTLNVARRTIQEHYRLSSPDPEWLEIEIVADPPRKLLVGQARVVNLKALFRRTHIKTMLDCQCQLVRSGLGIGNVFHEGWMPQFIEGTFTDQNSGNWGRFRYEVRVVEDGAYKLQEAVHSDERLVPREA